MLRGGKRRFTVAAKECYEVLNGEVSVTPENGQENLVSVVLSSTEDSLRLDVAMQDDNQQGFVTEIIVKYANAASFSMETDDGTVLRPVSVLVPSRLDIQCIHGDRRWSCTETCKWSRSFTA